MLCDLHRVRLVYLPPYANDLNPIEQAFSKAKAWLERNEDFAYGHPRLALGYALEDVDDIDARGFAQDSGYGVRAWRIPGLLP